ncbi:MAG: 30S ribosomal protein S6 [Candidatus Paceibacterota bacterium]|jgi:ribosomal protein S6
MSKKAKVAKNSEEKIYEVGYHIVSSVSEENIPSEVEKIKGYLAKEKAIIISEEAPKLRPLAYSIKKASGGSYKVYDKAYFGFIKFELGEDGDIRNIDLSMKNNESVLRYLVIKTVRENTMYSPKITIFSDKDAKIKTTFKEDKIIKGEKTATAEEIDKSIDALVADEVI